MSSTAILGLPGLPARSGEARAASSSTGRLDYELNTIDPDEIWEFTRADKLAAADEAIADILSAIRNLVPFPRSAPEMPGPDLAAPALHLVG